MARRLATVMCFTTFFLTGPASRADDAATRARPVEVQTSIRGATQMFAAPRGLVAQGSGQLRILPLGTSRWQTIHGVTVSSLYRIAFDDAGRLLAWWEKEPHFHLFVPGTKAHETFPLPPPPSPEFKYGYGVEDMYFTKDGAGAIVYMHGFIGGRTWVTVAYHYDLARRKAPTLLFRQPGHPLHKSSRVAVHAIPKKPDDPCEHNFCHPLGAVIAWKISGKKATKKVPPRRQCSQGGPVPGLSPCGVADGEQVAVLVNRAPPLSAISSDGAGATPRATFASLPPGPDLLTTPRPCGSRPRATWSRSGLTDERGLEIRRHLPNGKMKVSSLAPLPRRTPRDRPLFNIAGVMERASGDLFLHWGEYLVHLPVDGPARRLDLRTAFKRKTEHLQPAPPGTVPRRDSGRHRVGQDPRPGLPATSGPRGLG